MNKRIFYISDIHLEFYLERHNTIINEQIPDKMKEAVNNMINNQSWINGLNIIIIAGDLCAYADLAEPFLKELDNQIDKLITKEKQFKIIYILGNHELWDIDKNLLEADIEVKMNNILEKYKNIEPELKHTKILEREVLVLQGNKEKRYNEDEWISLKESELKKINKNAGLIILGSVGYSGCNRNFNAECCRIYRFGITKYDDDKRLSTRFELMHEILKTFIDNKNTLVVTHTPVEDWSYLGVKEEFKYINGHTHKNVKIKNEWFELYADNQTGYYEDPELKYFDLI